jgi:ABC-type glycerol-3-phosphate transport system substrate-binding protein
MVMRRPFRKLLFSLPILLVALLFLLAACGNSSAGTTAPAATHTSGSINPSAAATAAAYQRLVSLIGQPTVKMLTGTTFEADGQVKNIDTFQHDITLHIVLKDASGKVIASGSELLDNVKAGTIVSYAIKGTTSQPTWTSVEVVVARVSENIGGTGGD